MSETTLQDVQLQVTNEEAAQAALGNLPQRGVSLGAFLMARFELEDSQYVFFLELFHFVLKLL